MLYLSKSQNQVASIINIQSNAFYLLVTYIMNFPFFFFPGNGCIAFEGGHGCGRKFCIYEIEMMEAQPYIMLFLVHK